MIKESRLTLLFFVFILCKSENQILIVGIRIRIFYSSLAHFKYYRDLCPINLSLWKHSKKVKKLASMSSTLS